MEPAKGVIGIGGFKGAWDGKRGDALECEELHCIPCSRRMLCVAGTTVGSGAKGHVFGKVR